MMDPKELEVAKIMCALKKEWYEEESWTTKQFHLWLAEKIAQEEKGKRWVPEIGQKYFCIGTRAEVWEDTNTGKADEERIAIGNCYQTEAIACKYAALVRAAYIADVE